MRQFIGIVALALAFPLASIAQQPEYHHWAQGYFVIGFGKGTPFSYSPSIGQVGGGGEGFLYKGLGLGGEVGYLTGVGRAPDAAWSASGDLSYHFGRNRRRGKLDPFLLGGISYVGAVGIAAWGSGGSAASNFGGGANLWISERAALRIEFRDIARATDFWIYHHYLSWRIGVTFR